MASNRTLSVTLMLTVLICSVVVVSCNSISTTPYGPWRWGNQTLPMTVGLDDSIFVDVINRLPGQKLDSVFYLLSEAGYGPSKLFSGPTRLAEHFAVIEGIDYSYWDTNRHVHIDVFVYADRLLPPGTHWDEILPRRVKQVDVQHIRFNFSNPRTASGERFAYKPRDTVGYRVTQTSREWFGPKDYWR